MEAKKQGSRNMSEDSKFRLNYLMAFYGPSSLCVLLSRADSSPSRWKQKDNVCLKFPSGSN